MFSKQRFFRISEWLAFWGNCSTLSQIDKLCKRWMHVREQRGFDRICYFTWAILFVWLFVSSFLPSFLPSFLRLLVRLLSVLFCFVLFCLLIFFCFLSPLLRWYELGRLISRLKGIIEQSSTILFSKLQTLYNFLFMIFGQNYIQTRLEFQI